MAATETLEATPRHDTCLKVWWEREPFFLTNDEAKWAKQQYRLLSLKRPHLRPQSRQSMPSRAEGPTTDQKTKRNILQDSFHEALGTLYRSKSSPVSVVTIHVQEFPKRGILSSTAPEQSCWLGRSWNALKFPCGDFCRPCHPCPHQHWTMPGIQLNSNPTIPSAARVSESLSKSRGASPFWARWPLSPTARTQKSLRT